MKPYHVIKLLAPIGDHGPSIPDDAAIQALGPASEVVGETVIDLRDWFVDGDEQHVARAIAEISDKLRGLTPRGDLAIFGFAPIPLLMALGRIVGDKQPARVFDAHRHASSWAWEDPPTSDVVWDYTKPSHPSRACKDVVVLLSVSGRVVREVAIPWMPQAFEVYAITQASPAPNTVRGEGQLDEFRHHWRKLLDDVRVNHGPDARIHLFPAVPLSVAIECGRRLLPKVDNEVRVYDARNQAAHYMLTLTGPAVREGAFVDESAAVPARADLLVGVALPEEFEVLRTFVPSMRPVGEREGEMGESSYHAILPTVSGSRSVVFVYVGGMGQAEALLAIDRGITEWGTPVAVNVGIAGALDDDVALGDVVIPDQVDAFDDNLKAVEEPTDEIPFQHRGSVFDGDHLLTQRARNFRFKHHEAFDTWRGAGEDERLSVPGMSSLIPGEPNLHIGHLASGSIVSASRAFKSWLRTRDGKFLAIEMEAAALARSASHRRERARWLVIRGVSDEADPGKSRLEGTTKGAVRTLAMRNATRLFLEFVRLGIL